MIDWDQVDWAALDRLRSVFLRGTAGHRDYWLTESDLASYDATFAQRIGWKWDYALGELERRGWAPPRGPVLDWGCGSGIASRAYLDHFGTGSAPALYLWDRSPLAMRYAANRAREKYARLNVITQTPPEPPAVVLLSHVLTELNPNEIQILTDSIAAEAGAVLWIEPGTYEASLTLIAIRERLRHRFNPIAPCTHQARCGLLVPENERHWCHHFAPSPPEVFTDSHWAQFAVLAGIDLRSLPLSFLVLDKRPAPVPASGATRLMGRPRVYKGYASVLACDAGGVCERQITKRRLPELYRQAKKDQLDPLQILRTESNEIVESIAAHALAME